MRHDTTGSLAATGGAAPVDVLWLGLGMLLFGAGVYVLCLQRPSVKG
ncbi:MULTISPECIES: hypothetical protein [unclassified Microbacterium]|nr:MULTISPECIES: hypothetical protein [unclassified Microbacterium]MCR2811284.1 hypothetical protein [Microbacterium sp. zg.B185]WIM19442.1 hypothetical protein QNO12_01130 [Microbacterium sp. zg-B185]